MGEDSPLDHNVESVLPGVHSRMASMQSQMASGFQSMTERMEKGWQLVEDWHESLEEEKEHGKKMAQELVVLASRMLDGGNSSGSGGGGGGFRGGARGGGGDRISTTDPSSNQQQQAAAGTSNNGNSDLEKAMRHQLAPRHQSLQTIYFEWYGLESFKDKPIVGGFEKCEELFKSKWRKTQSGGELKQFSRQK